MIVMERDPKAHTHVDYFDTEDEAYSFIHGVHLGAHKPYIADAHGMNHYVIEDNAEALVYGIRIGILHRGRIIDCIFELNDTSDGFKVTTSVAAE